MEGLQATAGHTGSGNVVNIKLAVVGAVLVCILGYCPLNGLNATDGLLTAFRKRAPK